MTKISDFHRDWLKEPAYRAAYDALEEEFAVAAKALSREAASPGLHFEVFEVEGGAWHWSMVSTSGGVLARSRAYATKTEARKAITAFKLTISKARVSEKAA